MKNKIKSKKIKNLENVRVLGKINCFGVSGKNEIGKVEKIGKHQF